MKCRYFLLLTLACSCGALAKTSAPTHYSLNDNETAQIVLSNVDMNRIVINHDEISAIHCPSGFCVTGKTDGNGGALLSLANNVPFTFFLDTTKGKHIGVLALPASTTGKTVQLEINPTASEQLHAIEKSDGYDAKYITVIKSMLHAYWNHLDVKGYQSHFYYAKEQKQHMKVVQHVVMQPLKSYRSAAITGTMYLLSNPTDLPITLSPLLFRTPKAVAMSLASTRLLPHHVATVLIVEEHK